MFLKKGNPVTVVLCSLAVNNRCLIINMLGSQKIMSKIKNQEIAVSACYLREWMKIVKEIAERVETGFTEYWNQIWGKVCEDGSFSLLLLIFK